MFMTVQNFMLPLADEASSGWSLDKLLSGTYNKLLMWVGYIILIVGVILLGIAVFQMLKKFGSGGQGGMSWVTVIIMACVGGALMGGGIKFVYDLTKGAKDTIEDIGDGGKSGVDNNLKKGTGELKTIILTDDGIGIDGFILSDGTSVTIPK